MAIPNPSSPDFVAEFIEYARARSGASYQPAANIKTLSEAVQAGLATTPAILLDNPKYLHNLGAVIRAASVFGIGAVWFTGQRLGAELMDTKRIPREERMRGYGDVALIYYDQPLDFLGKFGTPIICELVPGAQPLHSFIHPENAIYVFGPEDGGVSGLLRSRGHQFVIIPAKHCLNLSAAVNVVLYDRSLKAAMPEIFSV